MFSEWRKHREEERKIREEVKDIHSDKEFQERYGLTDDQMAMFKLAWKQVFLPAEILITVFKVVLIALATILLTSVFHAVRHLSGL